MPTSQPQLRSDGTAPRTAYGELIDASVKYLADNGWRQSGSDGRNLPLFNDPTVAEAKSRVETRTLTEKDRDGEPIRVKQLVVPITDWDYKLEEAVAIQRDRDRIKAEAN